MSKNRIRALTSTIATVVFGLTLTSADAHFNPDLFPDAPGVGDPRGVYGSGPEVRIDGGRVELFRDRLIPISIECLTSTGAGCSGVIELADRAGRRASGRFDLDEGQSWTVFVALPAEARRLVRRRAGWKSMASTTVSDSLGRSGADSAAVTVRIGRR